MYRLILFLLFFIIILRFNKIRENFGASTGSLIQVKAKGYGHRPFYIEAPTEGPGSYSTKPPSKRGYFYRWLYPWQTYWNRVKLAYN